MNPVATKTAVPSVYKKLRQKVESIVEKTHRVSSKVLLVLSVVLFLGSGACFVATALKSPLYIIPAVLLLLAFRYVNHKIDIRQKEEKADQIRLKIDNLKNIQSMIKIAELKEEDNPHFDKNKAINAFFGAPPTRFVPKFDSKKECLNFFQFIPSLVEICEKDNYTQQTFTKFEIEGLKKEYKDLQDAVQANQSLDNINYRAIQLNNDLMELSVSLQKMIDLLQKDLSIKV